MSSQAGENTSLAPHNVAEEGNRKQSPDHGDQRLAAHCDHGSETGTVTAGTQDEKCKVHEALVIRSGYGSVDTVTVCRSCQHLYAGNPEVVLSPARLGDHPPHHDRHNPTNLKPVSLHRPWGARKYEGLCDCGASVSGGVCVCPGRVTHSTLHNLSSCNAPCLKKVKVAALVLAAILPWVFLVTYIVLTSI